MNRKKKRVDDVVTQVGAFAPLIMNAVKALVVLILGWIVAGAIGGMVRRTPSGPPSHHASTRFVRQCVTMIAVRAVTSNT